MVGVCSAGAASDLPVNSPKALGWSVRHWTVEDGLPERTVTSLAQTPDGYLWCGTFSGLARYDGERFVVFDSANTPALDEVQVLELRCDSSGRLWIGSVNGELVLRENGRFRRLTAADGIPPDQAGKLGGDPAGDFWVKGRLENRFYRYRDDRFEAITPGLPASNIDRFIADHAGLAWAVHEQERTMVQFTSQRAQVVPLIGPGNLPDRSLGRFFHLQDGRLAVTSSRGVYALKDSEWTLQAAWDQTIANQALDGVEDWDGNLWVSFVNDGLVFHPSAGRTARVALPEASDSPYFPATTLDAEGNLWICGSDGLYQLRRNSFQSPPEPIETRDDAALAVVGDGRGRMCIAYERGVALGDAEAWEFQPNANPEASLCTVGASRDGGFHLGFINFESEEAAVDRMAADGERTRLGTLRGFVRVILERQNGELWVATNTGLWKFKDSRFVQVPITGVSAESIVYAMIEDGQGRLLAGAFRHGLFRQEADGRWHRLTTTNDLGSSLIVSLYLDEQETLWAATDRGLARWKNERWFAYSTAEGALPGWVRGVMSDQHGGLWLTSQFGVTRVERQALNERAEGRNIELFSGSFDRSDGLPSVTCQVNQQAVFRSAEGHIWVATAKGAASVDPAHWHRWRKRRGAPTVRIEEAWVDDESRLDSAIHPGDIPSLVIPPSASRLELRFSAINLTAPRKSRFRYKLEGNGDKWVEAGNQRSVIYHRLPPGDHRFHVSAANNYGQWSTPGASLAFTILPKWWQTLWFRIGVAVFVVGGLWSSRSLKLRQLRRDRARREEFARRLIQSQEDERKRIASELHDSLGQNLLIAKNQLFLVQEMTAPQDERIQPKLRQIADSVAAALEEARAISHQLRPFQLERLGLTKAIQSMIKQTSDSTRCPIEAHIESVDGLLSAESEVMLYRILQEALSNVVKHADASTIQITLKRESDRIQLVVQDDGRGFDPNELMNADRPGGLGLTGFQERTSLLRGEFHCRSAPGEGTTLTFEFPVSETMADGTTDKTRSG